MNILKSVLHNIGVLIVGFALGFIGLGLDRLFGVDAFHNVFVFIGGFTLLVVGFLLRVWATYYFYQHQMKVISLSPQSTLLTTGPYGFSRNPLYLGGNVFIFFGAALILGSPAALVLTTLHLPLMDLMVRREEKQLEKTFGAEWIEYKKKVCRWI